MKIEHPPNKPLLIFDGECGFCRRWIHRWHRLTGGRVEYAPSQEAAARYPEVSAEAFARSVQLIEPDGTVTSGAEAVFKSLRYAGHGSWLWLYRKAPGFAPVSEKAYAFIASHRTGFSTATTALWGKFLEPSTFRLSRWVFLRLLGVIYLIAFLSLRGQIVGLVGANGILPVAELLQAVQERFGPEGYFYFPTLCWFNSGDAFLQGLCAAGAALSLFLIAGVAAGPALLGLWALYLSLTIAGRDFMSFQWDNLLLEAGFLAIFLAPWTVRPSLAREREPSAAVHWLFRWLLFRLMFSSGAVKLLSGDPSWRTLTALEVHYQTQPLPTWIGWYFHHFAAWFHKVSALVVFGVELVIPFLLLLPRRPRHLAAGVLIVFQVLIMLTGNYGFFNWLTIALCLLMIDDRAYGRLWPKRGMVEPAGPGPRRGFSKAAIGAAAILVLSLSGLQMAGLLTGQRGIPRWAYPFLRTASLFRTVNSYGLFAVMTTQRPEIAIEGSQDGGEWKPYEFKWKPGDPNRRPAFVAPHQPRLDWQMWFAALGTVRENPWVLQLITRLLQGEPSVLALLETNPFPEKPPRYIRAFVYEYRFANPSLRRMQGNWWERRPEGLYCAPARLRP